MEYQTEYIEVVKLGTLGIVNVVNVTFDKEQVISLPSWFKIKNNSRIFVSSLFSVEERIGAEIGVTNDTLKIFLPANYEKLTNLTGQIIVPLESF